MLGLNRPTRDRLRSGRSSDGLWPSRWQGCSDGWHVKEKCVKSFCCAGELVVPEPLDAVRRHLPF